jgi:hypothetical protein
MEPETGLDRPNGHDRHYPGTSAPAGRAWSSTCPTPPGTRPGPGVGQLVNEMQAMSEISVSHATADPATVGMDPLLTIEEVAGLRRVSVLTVRWLRQEGRFAPAIRVGRRLVWARTDVGSWVTAQREAA